VDQAAVFAQLMARFEAGDPAAADELYRRCRRYLRIVVRRQLPRPLRTRMDSLDLVHDVWTSVLAAPREGHRFDSPADWQQYLAHTAQFKLIDIIRRRFGAEKTPRRDVETAHDTMPDDQQVISPVATPSQWVMADEELERLLASVPAGHRAIVLRLRDGYNIDDIARLTNVSTSTVNRVVRRLKDLAGV
jgi:RNA polymerase sigma factor (sigma-70 family)